MFLVDGKENLLKSDDEEDLIFDHTSLLNKDARMKDLSHGCCPTGGKLQIARTINLCLSFFGLGLCFAIPTATLVDLQKAVNADENIKNIYTARYSGYLFGALIGGFLFDRYNRQFLLFLSLLATAIGILVMPFCQEIAALMACTAVTGITMGFLDTGGNVWCLDLWGRKSAPIMQTLHFCFGLGAFVAPIVAEPFLSPHVHITQSIIIGNETFLNGTRLHVPHTHVGLHPISLQSTKHARHLTFYESFYESEDESLAARIKRGVNDSEWLSNGSNISYSEQMSTVDLNIESNSTDSLDNSTRLLNSTPNSVSNVTLVTEATTTTKIKKKPSFADGNQLKTEDKWDVKEHRDQKGNLVISSDNKKPDISPTTTISLTSTIQTANSSTLISVPMSKPNNFTNYNGTIKREDSTDETTMMTSETKNMTSDQNIDQAVTKSNETNITNDDMKSTTIPLAIKSSVNESNPALGSPNISISTSTYKPEGTKPVNLPTETTTTLVGVRPILQLVRTTSATASPTTSAAMASASATSVVNVPTLDYSRDLVIESSSSMQNLIKLSSPVTQEPSSTAKIDNLLKSEDPQNISQAIFLSKDTINPDKLTESNFGAAVIPGSQEVAYGGLSSPDNQSQDHETKAHRINSDDYNGQSDFKHQGVTHFNSGPNDGSVLDERPSAENLKSNVVPPNNMGTPNSNQLPAEDAEIPNNEARRDHDSKQPNDKTDSSSIDSVVGTSYSTDSPTVTPTTKPGSKDFFITFFEILHKNRLGKFEIPYILLAVYIFVIATVFLVFLCKNPREPRSRQLEELSRSRDVSLSFRVVMVGLMSLFLCLYVGMEVGVGELLETFATKETLQLSPARGYFLPYLFWGSFAVARGISIFVATRFTGRFMLLTNLLICIAASVLLAAGADKLEALLWVGVVMLGTGMAPLFPTSISWLEHYLHVTNKTASIFVLGAAIGELIIPIVIDMFINQEPMVLMYVNIIVNALCFVSFIILCVMASKHSEKYQNKPKRSMYQLASSDDFEDGTELASNSNECTSNGYHLPVKRKLTSPLT